MKEFQMHFITDKHIIRTFKLLNAMKAPGSFTLKKLAEITSASDRTLLEDIKKIKVYFGNSIEIQSSNKGYSLKIVSNTKFIENKKALLNEEPLFKIIESIFYNEFYSVLEWSEKLYTTVSTLKNYLSGIKPILNQYDLSLKKDVLDFVGDEINIRKFFYDFYYESDTTPYTVFPSIDVINFSKELKQDYFFDNFTYLSFTEFNYILFIALHRFSVGKTVTPLSKDLFFLKKYVENYFEDFKNNKFEKLIYQHLDLEITSEEKIYLYLQLITKRSVIHLDKETNYVKQFSKWANVSSLAFKYSKLQKSLLEENKSKVLYESFFITIKLRHYYSPVLNQNIQDVTSYAKIKFTEQFLKNKLFIRSYLANQLDLSEKLIDDISANLTLFTNTLCRIYCNETKKIAFIFEGNRFLVQNIIANMPNQLEKNTTHFFPNSNEMSEDYFEKNDIDLIVTNYSEYLLDIDLPTKFVLFDLIPTVADWKNLEYIIYSL